MNVQENESQHSRHCGGSVKTPLYVCVCTCYSLLHIICVSSARWPWGLCGPVTSRCLIMVDNRKECFTYSLTCMLTQEAAHSLSLPLRWDSFFSAAFFLGFLGFDETLCENIGIKVKH